MSTVGVAARPLSSGCCWRRTTLAAAYKVFDAGWAMLPGAIAMVTVTLARAVRLHDRGAILPRPRADTILVDLDAKGFPRVSTTLLVGRLVFSYQRLDVRAPALTVA